MPPPNRILQMVIATCAVITVVFLGNIASNLSSPATPQPATQRIYVQPAPPPPASSTPAGETPAVSDMQREPPPVAPPTQPPPPVASQPRIPATPEEVAYQLGGNAAIWSKRDENGREVGENGWIYHTLGQSRIQFTVAPGMVVDTPTGRVQAGGSVDATDITVYWLP